MKLRDSIAEFERTKRERTVELSRLKKRLQKLSSSLIKNMENERRHVARELHDEIGQSLSLIKFNLQTMQRMPDALSIASHLEGIIGIIDSSMAQVRNLSYKLRPSMLDDHGLEAALKWFISRVIAKSRLEIKLVSSIQHTRLPVDIEIACYRAVQESLTNILKHAKAQRVIIKVSGGKGLSLSVSDDGVGFNVKKAMDRCMHGDSFGLLGMQERVVLAGGKLRIDSEPGKGTKISARFPLSGRSRR